MNVSVLTIVHGRQFHLENQLQGLLQSEITLVQWIAVGMNQDVELESQNRLAIQTGRIDAASGGLPLAKARNHAAAVCQTEGLIFLDVDCIPSPTMIGNFSKALSSRDALWIGTPLYLPAAAKRQVNETKIALGERGPTKRTTPEFLSITLATPIGGALSRNANRDRTGGHFLICCNASSREYARTSTAMSAKMVRPFASHAAANDHTATHSIQNRKL